MSRARLEGILLAARTIEHTLGNKLALTLGWRELLAAHRSLSDEIRPLAVEALHGAQQATTILRQLQALSRIEQAYWGPKVPATIDLARATARAASAPAAPEAAEADSPS